MATFGNTISLTYIAGEDLTGHQYGLVAQVDGLVYKTGLDEQADGVLMDNPASGDAASVVVFGRVTMKVAGFIPTGMYVGSNADGYGIPADGSAYIVGRTLETCAPGQIARVDFIPAGTGGIFSVAAPGVFSVDFSEDFR
jgi:hypothetical protein